MSLQFVDPKLCWDWSQRLFQNWRQWMNYPSTTPTSFLGYFLIFTDLSGVRRGLKMILSHREGSVQAWYELIPGHMNPLQMKSQWVLNKYKFRNQYVWNSFPEDMSLSVEKAFFRKLRTSNNDVERYRWNILGPSFRKHILFQVKDLWVLGPSSWILNLSYWFLLIVAISC